MLTVKFYKAEKYVPNGPEGLGIWGWRNCYVNGDSWVTDREEAEAIMRLAAFQHGEFLQKELAAADELNDVRLNNLYDLIEKSAFRIVDKEETFTHASGFGYTDVHPYEIIRIVSDKTIEVRRLDADYSIAHLDQVVGGFSSHVVNQRAQTAEYSVNATNVVERIRKNKKGRWMQGRVNFELQTEAYGFHDFNF